MRYAPQSLLGAVFSGRVLVGNAHFSSSQDHYHPKLPMNTFSRRDPMMFEPQIVNQNKQVHESSFFPLFTPNKPSRDYNNLVRYSINNNSVHLFSVSRQSLSGQIWSGEIFSNQQPTYKIQYEIQSLQKMPVGQVYKVVHPSGRLVASKSGLIEIAIC